MQIPIPEYGLVISFSYLWRHEYNAGRSEGIKARPCLIMSVKEFENYIIVAVCPITHVEPIHLSFAMEIPLNIKAKLGLDSEKSWIVLNDLNIFTWPGYDLKPTSKDGNNCSYGFVPPTFFMKTKSKLIDILSDASVNLTNRD